MENLIERYIYDVTRRLPENDRMEVAAELRANIYDMLEENPNENTAEILLQSMGAPASLAEKYRQNPKYLISPEVYEDYARTLKFVLPVVGFIIMVFGAGAEIAELAKSQVPDINYWVKSIIKSGISDGLSAVMQAFVWVTLGFFCYDRFGKNRESSWTLKKLPEIPKDTSPHISLAESITELVLTLVFSGAVIMICSGNLPIAFLFGDEFLKDCFAPILVITAFGIIESLMKIKIRKFTPLLCGVVVISNLITVGIITYLINRPDILSQEFISQISLHAKLYQSPVSQVITAVVVIASFAECAGAIYKTFKNYNFEGNSEPEERLDG